MLGKYVSLQKSHKKKLRQISMDGQVEHPRATYHYTKKSKLSQKDSYQPYCIFNLAIKEERNTCPSCHMNTI
jgi:hypothetical protein